MLPEMVLFVMMTGTVAVPEKIPQPIFAILPEIALPVTASGPNVLMLLPTPPTV